MHAAGCAFSFIYCLKQSVLVIQTNPWNMNSIKMPAWIPPDFGNTDMRAS
jgi:hypothetical protein